jgi:hypothetical protein
MPLLTKPLSRQERQAVELRRKGMSNTEIGELMQIPNGQVSQVISHARRKGAVVPYAKREPLQIYNKASVVPITRLVHIRTKLLEAGNPRYGVNTIIAERVGMKPGCVRVRLWKYDNQQGASR